MSKLETNTIDTVSGTSNLTIGGANNTGSTTIKTNNTDAVTIDNSQNLKFNSGFGSVATGYAVRAWVNFDGTGTPSISASGNVSSITDNGTGDFGINFTTAMPDANYVCSAQTVTGNENPSIQPTNTSSVRLLARTIGGTNVDRGVNQAIIVR
jgi:hypothetical protein